MVIRFFVLFLVCSTFLFSHNKKPSGAWLVKTCNKEKFMLYFPEEPKFSYHDDRHHFFSSIKETEYHITIEKKPDKQKNLILQEITDKWMHSDEMQILEKNLSEETVNIKGKTLEKYPMYWELDILVSEQNIYTFQTTGTKADNLAHKTFCSSFQVI